MRALLIDRLPNVSIAKKAEAGRPLNGVKVNDPALVQALLNYGTYDFYYYIRESSTNNNAEAYEHSERLRSLDLGSLESLRTTPPDHLVLFTSSHHLAKFVPFRQFYGHPEWPICGLTHGLSSNTLIPSYSWNYFSNVGSHDAIICTSMPGKKALVNVFDGLSRSESVAGRRAFFPPHMPVIPLGVDLAHDSTEWRRAQQNNAQGFVVLCLGRLTTSHKADLRPLISAFLRPNELPDNSTLILAGDDTHNHIATSLEEFASRFPSTRKVVVMPDISDRLKSALLQAADVALCMSDTYQETFGLSVLEAMAVGLPVVAPCWDGYQDLVLHGTTGFLARTFTCCDDGFFNSISMLIDPAFPLSQRNIIDMAGIIYYLAVLSRRPSWAKQMGERARCRAKRLYSWKNIIPKYEALWFQLVRRSGRLRPAKLVEPFGFMDYSRVFENHRSQLLTQDSVVSLCPEINDYLELQRTKTLFSPAPVAGFSDALDDRILSLCRKHGEIMLGDLIAQLQEPAMSRSLVTTQISRLAKYGLLSLCPRIESQSMRRELRDEHDTNRAFRPVSV